MAGRFITLEGGEGVGKSTLAKGLHHAIAAAGQTVVATREPGGTPGADDIRALLVRGAADRWSALTETLLLTAARNDHVERVIRPALAQGTWIVCDRFTDSTHAYQAGAAGLPEPVVAALGAIIDAPAPDLTLVLDIDPTLGLARARSTAAGEGRYEAHDLAYHARVRRAFLAIAAKEPARCVVIDATLPADQVLMVACKAIAARLGLPL